MAMINDKKARAIAILIDAENAQPSVTEGLLAEAAKYGVPRMKRIYGDWATQHMSGWKGRLLEHSIQPIQQFRYTTGKNASDSAMIIDAMDLMYSRARESRGTVRRRGAPHRGWFAQGDFCA